MGFFPKLAIGLVILSGVAYISFSGFIRYEHSKELQKAEKKYIGKMAPKDEVLQSYLGKKVVLIFWMINSKASNKEIDVVSSLYEEMKKKGLHDIVTVVLDENLNKRDLDEFIKKNGIKYRVLFDENNQGINNPFVKKFDILNIPSIWVIDENGKVIAQNLKSIFYVEEFLK